MISVFTHDSSPYIELIEGWWKHYYPDKPYSKRVCSNYVTLVYDDKQPIAAQYVYPALGSQVAWLGFTVRNPAIPAFRAGKALKFLFAESERYIKQLGWSIVFTNFDAPALQKVAAGRNYVGGTSHKEYWRDLWVE